MTLVFGTKNAVIFLGTLTMYSAEHPCPNSCRVPPGFSLAIPLAPIVLILLNNPLAIIFRHSYFRLYLIKHYYLFQQVTLILVAVDFGITVHTVTEEGSLDLKRQTNFIHKTYNLIYNTQCVVHLSFKHLVLAAYSFPSCWTRKLPLSAG